MDEVITSLTIASVITNHSKISVLKAILITGHRGPQRVRHQDSHISSTIGSSMSLSALLASHTSSPGRHLVIIYVRSLIDSWTILQLVG